MNDDQRRKLREPLNARFVRQREQSGRKLSYIEAFRAIETANEIFGHEGWDRETLELRETFSGERKTKNGDRPFASYLARVRVTWRSGTTVVIRDGVGAGSGFGTDPGEAHESAAKEAESDAMKRALMTFGWPFGLALYDKEQKQVADAPTVTFDALSRRLRRAATVSRDALEAEMNESARDVAALPAAAKADLRELAASLLSSLDADDVGQHAMASDDDESANDEPEKAEGAVGEPAAEATKSKAKRGGDRSTFVKGKAADELVENVSSMLKSATTLQAVDDIEREFRRQFVGGISANRVFAVEEIAERRRAELREAEVASAAQTTDIAVAVLAEQSADNTSVAEHAYVGLLTDMLACTTPAQLKTWAAGLKGNRKAASLSAKQMQDLREEYAAKLEQLEQDAS